MRSSWSIRGVQIGRRPEAAQWFSSVDQGICGHLTRRNLAALAEERGDHAEALDQWDAVLAECPGDPEARRCLERFSVR
jgi:ferric-dicitrate binding protein FerR (iron transport regulator)